MYRLFVPLVPSLPELLNQLLKRSQLLGINQFKLFDEENEVLEACVQVVLAAQHGYLREVGIVNMGVYSEEPFEDHLDYLEEILRERHSDYRGENVFVRALALAGYIRCNDSDRVAPLLSM